MTRILWLITLLGLLVTGSALAQDEADDTASEPTSTVNYIFFVCENQAVIDLNGTMQAGYDLYVQVFDGSIALGIGTGEALTALQRIPVGGPYEVSAVLAYNGSIVALGQYANARVAIARENDPTSVLFEDTVEDVQDGCVQPTFPATDAELVDIDPETGEPVGGSGSSAQPQGIFLPDGSTFFLPNPPAESEEPLVQLGARPSEAEVQEIGRANQPGWIFAECDQVPRGRPGTLYDTDNIVVFWSWFAETPELVQRHIDTAQYEVFFTSEFTAPRIFPNVVRTDIRQLSDGNYWVFYYADLGDAFRPGNYNIGYNVSWSEAISDGFSDFGPGTATPSINSTCTYQIDPNPFGINVNYVNP